MVINVFQMIFYDDDDADDNADAEDDIFEDG